MSRPCPLGYVSESSFPRVSGDEPVGRDSADDALAFSPRERG